jgi:hypothetical protein
MVIKVGGLVLCRSSGLYSTKFADFGSDFLNISHRKGQPDCAHSTHGYTGLQAREEVRTAIKVKRALD